MPPEKKRRVKNTVVNPPENEEVSAPLTTQETPEKKRRVKKTVVNPIENEEIPVPLTTQETSEEFKTNQVFELPEDSNFFSQPLESVDETAQVNEVFEQNSEPLFENLEPKAEPLFEVSEPKPESVIEIVSEEFETAESTETAAAELSNITIFDDEKTNYDPAPKIFQNEYKAESPGETIRQSGLAYSAAIVLFVSVVFMLVIGWLADLLLGSSPWGIVGGIIIGAIIGFVQFFRITSQIFKK